MGPVTPCCSGARRWTWISASRWQHPATSMEPSNRIWRDWIANPKATAWCANLAPHAYTSDQRKSPPSSLRLRVSAGDFYYELKFLDALVANHQGYFADRSGAMQKSARRCNRLGRSWNCHKPPDILGNITNKEFPPNRRKWSGRLDLNQRPSEPHSDALPSYATPRTSSR